MTTPDLDLTRRWLALTHEAIWTYGLIGARFPAVAKTATAALQAHQKVRDRLSDVVRELGGAPVATRATYDIGDPQTQNAGRALARDVESRIAATCVRLVPVSTDDSRDRAVDGLRAAALAQVRWGAEPEPFPGLD